MTVIQAAWVPGLSTLGVDDLVRAMEASGICESEGSQPCVKIDERMPEAVSEGCRRSLTLLVFSDSRN